MKVLLAFAVLVASIYAVPSFVPQVQEQFESRLEREQAESRFVDGIVAELLENVSQQIQDAGLDPFVFEQFELKYELPVATLFSIDAFLNNLVFSGASNIVINRINYSVLQSRLDLDISLPEIAVGIDGAGLNLLVFSNALDVRGSGRLSIIQPRISGDVRLNLLGVIGGSIIREVNLGFDLGDVQFNGQVNFQGNDMNEKINEILGNILETIRAHKNEIDQLIEIVLRDVVNNRNE